MDKTWIEASQTSTIYKNGAQSFINFAQASAVRGEIKCPCLKCCNLKWLKLDLVHRHIRSNGFLPGYTMWTLHGEQLSSSELDTPFMKELLNEPISTRETIDENVMRNMLRDALGFNNEGSRILEEGSNLGQDSGIVEPYDEDSDDDICNDSRSTSIPDPSHNIDPSRFQKLLDDCDEELYPGCKYSKLSFNLHLYHLKCFGGMSNKIFTMLLEFLRDVFPHVASIPCSTYEAKKLTNDLGLGYKKIHACPNDCMLFWGENEHKESCFVCHTSRWKKVDEVYKDMHNDATLGSNKKKKPAKVLRYFPLIPRLKRIYMSIGTSKDMRWHAMDRTKDGKLRHPADAMAWKAFDEHYPEFASDPRSIRLGLASDGFNPFRTMSTTYSTWPVLLIPYNLPPWQCMKQHSLILSMIIPGEKGPGNDIDIYLQVLVDELKQLWDGVDAYDALLKENFKMRAALLWTINDFPAYANLSGWSTKGRVACPICTDSTSSIWLKHGKKFSYMGHRRWLEQNHPSRFQKGRFDGTIEHRSPPFLLSGSNVLKQLEGTNFTYGKKAKSSKKRSICQNSMHVNLEDDVVVESNLFCEMNEVFEDGDNFIEEDFNGDEQLWKKRSIFFDLHYWEYNLLRHNLDVMHIEKNVCDNLLRTVLNLDGKTKDNEKARRDLMEMGIRHELHPVECLNKKPYLPPACYSMSTVEKNMFLQVLKDLKVPDGYASNISRGVNLKDRKLSNLKSHDGHILMQDLLPIALRASMFSLAQSRVVKVVSDLCSFFKGLCAKVLDVGELDELQHKVIKILCDLEELFLPSFFTIMVHLIIHLVNEAKLGGPVHYRWMYPIERFLVRLKAYVRNRAQPEGSIAEGYLADECIIFCSRYFNGVQTSINRPQRNDIDHNEQGLYCCDSGGRVLGKVETMVLDDKSLAQAHRYMLLNHKKLSPYRDYFISYQKSLRHGQLDPKLEEKLWVEEFRWWLQNQVPTMEKNKCDEELIALALGPSTVVKRYKGYIINGFRFHTKERERFRRTQNSGVAADFGDTTYYGCITDIIELDYFSKCKAVLFRCNWVDIRPSRGGLKKDKFGFPLVNFSKLFHIGHALKDDPYIFSSDAKQVFYVADHKDVGWSHVIMTKPRDIYDMGSSGGGNDEDSYTQCMPFEMPQIDGNEVIGWRRTDVEEEEIY